MSIRFAELPASHTTANAWEAESEALRANPGQWAHFEEFDGWTTTQKTNLVGNIKHGRLKAFREGVFEARCIKGQIWARFTGDA